MAKVYLEAGDNFVLSSAATVYGSTGTEKLVINSGVTGVIADPNIERVDLAGASTGYTFQQAGNQLKVFSGTSLVATIPVQEDANGTQVVFSNGSVEVKVGATGMTLGGATVPSTAAAAVTPTTIDSAVTSGAGSSTGTPTTGQAFSLTNSATPDVISGTTGNDTITGGAGTYAATDVIADSTTTDSDVFNLVANTALGGSGAVINNIETINATGEYATVAYNAASTSGTKTLNLAAGIIGSTATVTGVKATGVAEIVAGNNIGTLEVSSGTTGTVGTVKVNAGSATSVTLNGTASVADTFDLTLSNKATSLTLATGTGTDAVTVNLAGNTLSLTPGAGVVETLNLVSKGAANTVTIASGTLVDSATTSKAVVSGDQNLTLIGDPDALTGLIVEKTGTGTLTFKTNAGATAMDLSKVAADVVDVNFATGAVATTYNSASTVKLSVANNATSYNIDNAAGTLTTGTLSVDVNADQTAFGTGAKVDTLKLNTNVANATITTLTTDNATDTIVLSGAKNLTISTLTSGDADVISATGMTGKFTLTTTSAGTTVIGGSGNDSLSVGDFTGSVVRGGDGNDTINGAATNASSLFGDAGNDSVTGGSAADTIDGGAGDDVLTGAAGNDTILGGEGNDIIIGGAGADSLTGGAGNDVYQLAATSSGVNEVQTLTFTSAVTGDGNLVFNVAGASVTIAVTSAAQDTAAKVATAVAAGTFPAGVTASVNGANVLLTFAAGTHGDATLVTAGTNTATGGAWSAAETQKGVSAVAASDSSENNLDVITDWASGDKIDLSINMSLDTTAVTGTTTAAGLSTNGLISFASLTTQPTSLNAAATLVAAAVAGGTSTAAGEAAVFTYDGASYLFVSDGTAAYSATTDTLVKLAGVTTLSTGITLFGGDITAIA